MDMIIMKRGTDNDNTCKDTIPLFAPSSIFPLAGHGESDHGSLAKSLQDRNHDLTLHVENTQGTNGSLVPNVIT